MCSLINRIQNQGATNVPRAPTYSKMKTTALRLEAFGVCKPSRLTTKRSSSALTGFVSTLPSTSLQGYAPSPRRHITTAAGRGCNCARCSPQLIIQPQSRFFAADSTKPLITGQPIKKLGSNDGSGPYGSLPELFELNRAWAEEEIKARPDFFERLTKQQSPKYLWIGCSDSRVPANQVVGLAPGELFVHRNVANVVVHSDLNCLSVLQYAVEYLKVEHVIVCGHYGCGGVLGALRGSRLGLIDNWLRHIVDVRDKHSKTVDAFAGLEDEQHDILCELNVIEQAQNVAQTSIVRDAWRKGQNLQVHSWIYGLEDGKMKDLGLHVKGALETKNKYDEVIARYSV